jgi:hypothetical protein
MVHRADGTVNGFPESDVGLFCSQACLRAYVNDSLKPPGALGADDIVMAYLIALKRLSDAAKQDDTRPAYQEALQNARDLLTCKLDVREYLQLVAPEYLEEDPVEPQEGSH